MTLQAPTLLDTTSGGTTSLVSDSISPSANSLIVIACVGVQTAAPYVSATTLSGLSTWGSVTVDSGGAETTLLWSKVTGSPGTGTITVTGYGAAGGTRNQMAILEVVGANTIRQVKSGTSTSAAPSLVFDITPLSSSLVVAAFGQEGSGYQAATPGANFTELVEVGGDRCIQVQYDLTGASSTVDWSLGGSRQYGAVAIEITDE